MANCLVTKLKESVANDNLDVLNQVTMHITFKDGFPVEGTNLMTVKGITNNFTFYNKNTDGASLVYGEDGTSYLKIVKGETDTLTFAIESKYDIKETTLFAANVRYRFNDVAKFYSLNKLIIPSGVDFIEDSIERIVDLQNLTSFTTSGLAKRTDISIFNNIPSLEAIEINYSIGFFGDLSSIKDMPNLQTVTLNHVYVTDNNNTVEYLQNRGVTVTYTPYE